MSSITEQLQALKVIPVIAIEQAEDIIPLGAALANNGLPVAEITFRSAAAVEAIRLLRQSQPEMLIGAGTVLNPAQLDAALNAGAQFIVSPGLTKTLGKAAIASGAPFLPGVATSSELMRGLEQGLDTFKFFPAVQAGGAAMLAAWNGPFGDVRFCPTGGIGVQTAAQFLHLPNVLCVGGSWLTTRDLLAARDWAGIERLAREAALLAG